MSATDQELLARAVRCAGDRGKRSGVRWSFVADLFLVGSTTAIELCRRFNQDPEEIVGQDPECEEGCECQCHEL